MVAFAKKSSQEAILDLWRAMFAEIVPLIENQAAEALKDVEPELKQTLIKEAVENALLIYMCLAGRGNADLAYPKPLVMSAVKLIDRRY